MMNRVGVGVCVRCRFRQQFDRQMNEFDYSMGEGEGGGGGGVSRDGDRVKKSR